MEVEQVGPYRIVGKLGRGGMGTVYEGVHCETGDPAAVKLLSAALADEEGFRVRFEAEIETLRKLNHPNIVRLFGFGEQDGQLFYSMELVDGNSLEEELRQGRRFDWREVARIGIETCHALRHAHDRGIIHRDIKPGNLLLATDGRVKLSDFGIARLFGYTRMTITGNVLGTAEYMAPEQAEGRPVDARADLYSLGALMYALLARRPVFRSKSLPDMLHKQRFEQPESIRKHVPDTPEELESILGQLLEKDPERRIPNADLLARRLEAMLHALSMGPETMEASPDWFLPGESAPPSGAAGPAPPPNNIPATQVLDPSVRDLPVTRTTRATEQSEEEGQEPFLFATSATAQDSDEMAVPAHPTNSRFIPVREEELGQIEEEEPQPAMISWQTWALVAALLSVGLSVWWFLQPPTADALFERIADETADESMQSILQAEDDIREFLNRYSGDKRAARLREYEEEINLHRLERKFELRVKGRANTESLKPIERAYVEAINYIRLDPELGMAKLQAIVDLYGPGPTDSNPVEQCLVLTRRRLAKLRQEVEKRKGEQLALLHERLTVADSLGQSEPDRAQAIYRAIVELYANKPWAAEAVRHARESEQKGPSRQP